MPYVGKAITKPNPILAYIAGPFSADPVFYTSRAIAWGQAALAAGEILRLAHPDLWGGVMPVVPHIIGLAATSVPRAQVERYSQGESVLTLLPGRAVVLPTPPESWWYDATLELMRRCDLVIVAGHSDMERAESVGTLGELAEAERLGIPVIDQPRDPGQRRGPTHDDVVWLADEMTALWQRGLLPREGRTET